MTPRQRLLRRHDGAASLARIALVATLLAGCVSAPNESGTRDPSASLDPSTAPIGTGSPPTQEPSGPPTGEHIVVHWDRYPALATWEINAIEVGDNGWVGLGNCRVDGRFDEGCAVAVTSVNGQTWTEHPIPNGEDLAQAHDLTRVLDGWVVVGVRLWSSPDGATWQQGGKVEVACCLELEGHRYDVAPAPSGSLVAWMPDGHGSNLGPFVSKDGLSWTLVDQAAFDSDTFEVDRIAATASEVLLSGGPCGGCVEGIWSSTDGRTWTKVADPAILEGRVSSFASDGATTIASVVDCPTYAGCRTHLWASVDGAPWSRLMEGMNVRNAKIVVTDAGFVAIGDWRRKYAQFASIDGRIWTEVVNDGGLPAFDDEDCGLGFVTAWHDTILLGSPDCGWWRGTVATAAGPGVPPAPEATNEPIPSLAVASLGPSQTLEATAVLGDVCLDEPGHAEIPIVVTWSGNVPIGEMDVLVDGAQGGNLGFAANTFGTQGFTFVLRTTVPHTARIAIGTVGSTVLDRQIVKVFELTFNVDPKNACD